MWGAWVAQLDFSIFIKYPPCHNVFNGAGVYVHLCISTLYHRIKTPILDGFFFPPFQKALHPIQGLKLKTLRSRASCSTKWVSQHPWDCWSIKLAEGRSLTFFRGKRVIYFSLLTPFTHFSLSFWLYPSRQVWTGVSPWFWSVFPWELMV